jgi:hypothetical protein
MPTSKKTPIPAIAVFPALSNVNILPSTLQPQSSAFPAFGLCFLSDCAYNQPNDLCQEETA